MLILIFATVHSGLASLRDVGEKLIGERAFRVLFAGVSLPLAMSTIVSLLTYYSLFLHVLRIEMVTLFVGHCNCFSGFLYKP